MSTVDTLKKKERLEAQRAESERLGWSERFAKRVKNEEQMVARGEMAPRDGGE